MRISRRDSEEPYFLSVRGLRDGEWGIWNDHDIGVLTVANPSIRPSIDPRMLAEFMGITLVEAEVAAALGNGLSPAVIAKRRDVQANTNYAHIKSIVRKTGYAGQADIGRRVVDLARIFGNRPSERGNR